MAKNLRPCPVCGSQALYVVNDAFETEYGVFCNACKLIVGSERAETAEDAIEEWNSMPRIEPERTCHVTESSYRIGQNQVRTKIECSECGYIFGGRTYNEVLGITTDDFAEVLCYCPNCGAKVVDK